MTARFVRKLQLNSLEYRDVPSISFPSVEDRVLLVGSDAGTSARVWDYSSTFAASTIYFANSASDSGRSVYETDFTGGVRTAAGDFDRSGTVDTVTIPGPGRPVDVIVNISATGPHLSQQGSIRTFTAFESSFTGGGFVSVGDFGGTSAAGDLIVTPDQGGGPRVRIFRGGNPDQVVADFLGIEDPNFRGGARTAVGDVNGDGVSDLIVAAGFGGGPRIAVWDGRSIAIGQTPRKLFGDFFVFEQTLRNGVYLASADLNGDQADEIIVGAGPGGAPRVSAISGFDLVNSNRSVLLANFFAGDSSNRSGVRLAIKDVNDDLQKDLVVGQGDKSQAVTAYSGQSLLNTTQPIVLKSFTVQEAFTGTDLGFPSGVFV